MTTATTSIHLGPIYAGLTLVAQLIDTAGAPVGDPITTGFVEIGNGDYLWTADTSAVEQGGVLIYEDGAPSLALAVGAIQPSAALTAAQVRAEMDANSTQLAAILEDTGTTLPALINTRSTLGAGALAFTYTLTSSVTGLPVADADVWVTTDAGGTNVVASGQTNASGQVTFYLDVGTIYVWRQKDGWNFTNPDTETVS